MTPAFNTPIEHDGPERRGPFRAPRQMLAVQEYDGHASIHDDATARSLGFKGGTIEGPTHFSQFEPLAFDVWGEAWFRTGCLSAHYRNPVFEGEDVQAVLNAPDGGETAEIWMRRADETEILRGSASIGASAKTALDGRLAELTPLDKPVILADVKLGMKSERAPVRMDPDQIMGRLYPFSLTQKLERITEPSPWFAASASPWRRPVVPMEMISVLMQYSSSRDRFPTRGPAVGLFADQEIRLIDGPVFVGQDYEVEREVVFMSGSKRTESMWTRSTLYRPGEDQAVASMLLNLASMRESYADYEKDRAALHG